MINAMRYMVFRNNMWPFNDLKDYIPPASMHSPTPLEVYGHMWARTVFRKRKQTLMLTE